MDMKYRNLNSKNRFQISNKGLLRNKLTNHVYKLHKNKQGYLAVCVSLGSRESKKVIKIHRAVATTFLNNPNDHPVINHIDGHKLNNNIENLEWCTHSHNTIHAYKNGLIDINKGDKSRVSKLTEFEIRFILENYKSGDRVLGQRGLGRIFEVHHGYIASILKGD